MTRLADLGVGVVTRRVIVEEADGYWLAVGPDGTISEHPTAPAAKAAIDRASRRLAQGAVVVTIIEWRPLDAAGFEPPA